MGELLLGWPKGGCLLISHFFLQFYFGTMITGCLTEGGCLIGDHLMEGQLQFHTQMDLASPILPSFVGEEYSIFDWGIEGSQSVFFLLAPNSNLASVFAYIFTA